MQKKILNVAFKAHLTPHTHTLHPYQKGFIQKIQCVCVRKID
jgi:hypothetical protein